MKIKKAIEVLSNYNHYVLPGLSASEETAIKLSIEALKRHMLRRQVGYRDDKLSLPGETK